MAMPRLVRRTLITVLQIAIPYLVVETCATTYGRIARWDGTYYIMEDTGRTFFFDPIRGYRLGRTPSRCIRYAEGKIEYAGEFRGNSQGFQYRSDFEAKKPRSSLRRYAVFGDSFTHAPFLSQSWPERVEDLLQDRGVPIAMLNFAQWGAGLGNWWSIITKLLDAEDYELDGVIFAVFESDMRRRFTVFAFPEPRDAHDCPLFGRWPSWNPATLPQTIEQAKGIVDEGEGYHPLSYDEFERAAQGEWPASVPRPFALTFASKLKERFERDTKIPDEQWAGFGDRQPLVDQIRAYLQKRHLPAMVLYIPMRVSLLKPGGTRNIHWEETRRFAEAIGATFVDAAANFSELSVAERTALYFPHDPHWNQRGSNRFADLVVAEMDKLYLMREPSTE